MNLQRTLSAPWAEPRSPWPPGLLERAAAQVVLRVGGVLLRCDAAWLWWCGAALRLRRVQAWVLPAGLWLRRFLGAALPAGD
ncbi:MAG: hypothetical protein K1X89_23935 [Myxococcaceae bacterium]|nr:hypothetical protein [Myxococcaceae bacterium]